MKRLNLLTLLTLLIMLGAACTATSPNNSEATAPAEATTQPTQDNSAIRLTPLTTPAVEAVPTSNTTPVVGEVPEDILTAVFDDLNSTTAAAPEAITVVQAEAVVWSDGALGCPQPGEVYTMMPVAGYKIVAEVDGRTYNYHATDTGYVILCENALPQPPAVGTPTS